MKNISIELFFMQIAFILHYGLIWISGLILQNHRYYELGQCLWIKFNIMSYVSTSKTVAAKGKNVINRIFAYSWWKTFLFHLVRQKNTYFTLVLRTRVKYTSSATRGEIKTLFIKKRQISSIYWNGIGSGKHISAIFWKNRLQKSIRFVQMKLT